MAKRKTNKKFTEEVFDLVHGRYEFLEEYVNTKTKIKCRHNECGYEWRVKPDDFLRGSRCPSCAGNKKKTDNEFINEVKALVGNEYIFLEKYINSKDKILCKHTNCNHEWRISPNNFLAGKRCPNCR